MRKKKTFSFSPAPVCVFYGIKCDSRALIPPSKDDVNRALYGSRALNSAHHPICKWFKITLAPFSAPRPKPGARVEIIKKWLRPDNWILKECRRGALGHKIGLLPRSWLTWNIHTRYIVAACDRPRKSSFSSHHRARRENHQHSGVKSVFLSWSWGAFFVYF